LKSWKVSFENGELIIAGLVLDTIRQKDILSVRDKQGKKSYEVREIICYGHKIDKIGQGMTTKLVLGSDDKTEFPSHLKYMYKLQP
jgi:hypothetical protein